METPIPRGCKSIEDAVELIEAMRQDGEHGFLNFDNPKPEYLHFDGTIKPSFKVSIIERNSIQFFFPNGPESHRRIGWSDYLYPDEISETSVRLLWL